jgi:hypothetical protein
VRAIINRGKIVNGRVAEWFKAPVLKFAKWRPALSQRASFLPILLSEASSRAASCYVSPHSFPSSWVAKPVARSEVYTKNGRPLQVSADVVYSRSGKVVGRISGHKVFGTNGRYVGTIDGDRLVYRSTDTESIGSSFTTANMVGTATASVVGTAMWGDEPDIPD